MDNHPPVRRPHKSPAHTFKDRGLQPQRFVLHPVVTEVPEGAAHYTAVLDSVNTVNRIFFFRPTAAFPLGGSIILASLHVSSTTRSVIFLPPRRRFRLPGRASYSSFRIRQAFPSPPFPRPATASKRRWRGAHCAHAQSLWEGGTEIFLQKAGGMDALARLRAD